MVSTSSFDKVTEDLLSSILNIEENNVDIILINNPTVDRGVIIFEQIVLKTFIVDLLTWLKYNENMQLKNVIMDKIYAGIFNYFNDLNLSNLMDTLNGRLDFYKEGIKATSHYGEIGKYATLTFVDLFEDDENAEVLNSVIQIVTNQFESIFEAFSLIDSLNTEVDTYEDYIVSDETEILNFIEQLNFKSSLEIHFHHKLEASVFSEVNVTGKEQYLSDVFLFCNFTLRQMVNLSNTQINDGIAEFLSKADNFIDVLSNNQIENNVQLVQYQGSPGKKRFISNLDVNIPKGQHRFIMKSKGFGLLSIGMDWYAPQSIVLLLMYFYKKYQDNDKMLETLTIAANNCATVYYEKLLKLGNVNTISYRISYLSFLVKE